MKLDFIKNGKLDFLKRGTTTVKREREKKITRLHIILFALVVIVTTAVIITVKVKEAQRLAKYRNFEKNLVTASRYFYGNKESEIERGEQRIITMKTVVDNGYLQDSLTSVCNGYTIISNTRNLEGEYEIEYDPYIRCGKDYETDNFSENNLK